MEQQTNKITKFSDLHIEPELPLQGKRKSVKDLIDQPIIIKDFRFTHAKIENQTRPTIMIQFTNKLTHELMVTFTQSSTIRKQLQQVSKEQLPIEVTIKQTEHDKCIYLS